MNGKVKFD